MNFAEPIESAPAGTTSARAIGPVPQAYDARHRFLAADALRGIAALIVLLYHLEAAVHGPGWFARGYLAVDFFFMLSGFVMAHCYDGRWSRSFGTGRFLRARIRRLWPTMAGGILAGATLALASGATVGATLGLTLRAMAFVPLAGARDGLFPLDGVQWSLFFELIANLAHAVILHRLSDRRLAIVTALFAASLFAIAYVAGDLSVGDAGPAWIGGFFRVGFAYPAGMLLHRLWRRRAATAPTNPLLVLAALPVALIGCSASRWWATDPLLVVTVVPMIIWLALSANLPARLAMAATAAGRVSYPLYALHRPLIGLALLMRLAA
ncbi:acyltransferase family protein [Sphingomonas sp. RT2P30]|uniref:acyltransferase family protein n=1 Tax=Parasphingomonas halimpatiens TaxID=3096162 RepID=UPI002FCA9ED8